MVNCKHSQKSLQKNSNETLNTYYPTSTVTNRQLTMFRLYSHLLSSLPTQSYFEANPRENMMLQLEICMIFNHFIN